MKKKILGLWIILFVNFAYASFYTGADKLINQISPTFNLGIEVVDLTSGKILYSRHADRLLVPASNMKLFSNAAVLMILGPDYRFKNQLSTDANQLQQGNLHGSLYLQLSGDPSFSHERLALLLNILKAWHIQRIKGNIYIDSNHAQVDAYPLGWMEEDLVYGYGAPIAPLMIDANRITVTVNQANNFNKPAIIETDDISNSIVISNQVQTQNKNRACKITFKSNDQNQITVVGCIAIGNHAIQQQLAIRNPLLYAQQLIKQQLHLAGIKLDGNILLGNTPTNVLILKEEFSKPVAQLMADTLKTSDNLYADSLFLHAAEKLYGAPVNWQLAATLLKNFMFKQANLDLNTAKIADGSGLSRDNLISAKQTVALLRFIYDKFPLSYEYITALPVAGRDGTLQRRLKKATEQDLVRAKTGTMKGIASLSGYLYTANNHTVAFAIFINNLPGSKVNQAEKYRYLIDALCSYFLQQLPQEINLPAKNSITQPRLQFQQHPTQADIDYTASTKWCELERLLKISLQNYKATVLYREHELIIKDNESNMNRVLIALKNLRSQYAFVAILFAKDKPVVIDKNPLTLWVEKSDSTPDNYRIWSIRDVVH